MLLLAILFIAFEANAKMSDEAMIKKLNAPFVTKLCTLIITGNLHTKHSNCTTGIGSCIKIVIKLPKVPITTGARGVFTPNPKDPNHVIVDFLKLDDEQMKEDSWEIEDDIIIDDPGLADEPGGYKKITLLKGMYEIDRTENEMGRCVVKCKAE